jgi:N-acetyl-anhydromuramyl-L-alanine amidase AmpD
MIRLSLFVRVLCLLGVSGITALAQNDQLKIIDHLMDEAKVTAPRGSRPIEYIMLHFSSDAAAHPESPYNVDRVIGTLARAGASAHYLIDREGNVYRLVKETRTAWHAGKGTLPWNTNHVGGMNAVSVGIEMMNISTWHDMRKFISKKTYDKVAKKDIGYTDAQYKSLNLLLADVRSRWPQIKMDRHHIIAHSTYLPKDRTDPGELFDWTRIGLPAEMPKD